LKDGEIMEVKHIISVDENGGLMGLLGPEGSINVSM